MPNISENPSKNPALFLQKKNANEEEAEEERMHARMRDSLSTLAHAASRGMAIEKAMNFVWGRIIIVSHISTPAVAKRPNRKEPPVQTDIVAIRRSTPTPRALANVYTSVLSLSR